MAYVPGPVPQDAELLATYLINELHRIAAGIDTVNDVLGLSKTYKVPIKPYDGQIAYADGVYWNPGNGQGLYQYNGIGWSSVNNANKNYIINGKFDIAQRATSQTATGYGSLDRWGFVVTGTTQSVTRGTLTFGQNTIPDGHPTHYVQVVTTSVAGANNYAIMYQKVEGVETLSNGKVTLTFWAYTTVAKNICIEFVQSFGTTGSPSASVTSIGVTTIPLTTTWKKYTVTASIPSVNGKTIGTDNNDSFQVLFWLDAGSTYNSRTNSLGQQSGTFGFTSVKLEEGSAATGWDERTPQEELTLCERYYQKHLQVLISGYNAAGGAMYGDFSYNTTMRAAPTPAYSNQNYGNSSAYASNGSAIYPSHIRLQATVTAAGAAWAAADISLEAEI